MEKPTESAWQTEPDPLLEAVLSRAAFLVSSAKAAAASKAVAERREVMMELLATQRRTNEDLLRSIEVLHARIAVLEAHPAGDLPRTVAPILPSPAALMHLETELDGLRLQMEAVHRSTSWRVTAPLRRVRSLLGPR